MSLSTTSGSAERLQRAGGAWRMEFEQLVYNAPAILRPRRFAVLGEHAILQQLREFGGHEPLAKDAERLFARGALPDGTYIARNGRWLPELRPDVVVPEPEAPEPEPNQLSAGAADEMKERIASLETTVKALQKMVEASLRALNDLAARPAAAAAPPATPAPASIPAAPAVATPAAGPPVAAAPAPRVADPNEKVIALPSVGALTDLVKSLAGPDAVLSAGERMDWAKAAVAGPVYAAAITNHDGHHVGAMILDVESALRLAGALLMESEDMITSLVEEKMMSDEMLDAASEVCNTLMSSFNKISGNPHLRVGKLVQLSEADASWIATARKCDDYRYSQGGRLAMAMR